jgi:thiol:disulfide interchange protein
MMSMLTHAFRPVRRGLIALVWAFGLVAQPAYAQFKDAIPKPAGSSSSLPSSAGELLDASQAFKLAVKRVNVKQIAVTFQIAPGYYMYRDNFKFTATDATLGKPTLPRGVKKFDVTFNKTMEIYRDSVTIKLSLAAVGAKPVLRITSQGCADAGVCYPPVTEAVSFPLAEKAQ